MFARSRSPSLVPANIVRCNEGSERRAKEEGRVKEEAAFEIDEAGARGRVLYLLPSLPLFSLLCGSGAQLSHHPHPTERPTVVRQFKDSRHSRLVRQEESPLSVSLSAAMAARQ